MRRKPVVLAVIALAIGYVAIVALGIVVVQQQSELRSIQARLAPSPGSSPIATTSPVAITTVSPSPTANASPSPQGTPTATPSACASQTSCYPLMQKVTDNFGDRWDNCTGACFGVLTATAGTVYTFTAFANDPLNRPLQFVYWTGTLPGQHLLCDWGGPTCSWTAQAGPGGGQVFIYVAVRSNATVHRMSPCGTMAFSCDDKLPNPMLFNVVP